MYFTEEIKDNGRPGGRPSVCISCRHQGELRNAQVLLEDDGRFPDFVGQLVLEHLVVGHPSVFVVFFTELQMPTDDSADTEDDQVERSRVFRPRSHPVAVVVGKGERRVDEETRLLQALSYEGASDILALLELSALALPHTGKVPIVRRSLEDENLVVLIPPHETAGDEQDSGSLVLGCGHGVLRVVEGLLSAPYHRGILLNMEEHIGETVERILERNARVESDKAWETSFARIGSIAVITYVCAAVLMLIIGVARPLLSALIPVLGFVLSTQSLPLVKKKWLEKRR